MKLFQYILKRIFDYCFSVLLVICSSPFMLIAILAVKICSPESPVFFKQARVGKNGKEIIVYKLRSMTNDRDLNGEFLPDEDRLKLWGKIIRKTNLDEIPQVKNIFMGEMSLIGPRPLLPREMSVMSEEEQHLRQSVLPGITGWEAINESQSDDRYEMALLDLYYVKNWSFFLDMRICFKTAYVIFFNKRPADELRAPKLEEKMVKK